jgi:hypothetical protein
MSKLINPADLAKAGSEHAEQVALFAWAALNIPKHPELKLLFAIPNGGLRSKITAANLKAEGVRSGVLDIFLPVARGPWHGLFIEMKKQGGRATPEQLTFIDDVRAQGFGASICVGWEKASQVLLQYLDWRK